MEPKSAETPILSDLEISTVPESVTEVLENDLLLEKIFIFAIQRCCLWLETKRVCDIRLVSKMWLLTISRLLRRLERPVYTFYLGKEQDVRKLRKFVNGRKCSNIFDKQESLVTYELNLNADFLENGDHQLLRDCLVECGYSLKEILIEPASISSFIKCYIPRLSLPLLQRIYLVADISKSNSEILKVDGVSVALFWQSIISCATQLKTCVLRTKYTDNLLPVEVFTMPALLPKTISELRLGGTSYGHNLQKCLEMMDLPNLSRLEFQINKEEQRLPKLKTLHSLSIYNSRNKNVSVLFSGTLQNLRHLEIQNVSLKKESRINDLTSLFPNICSVKFSESSVTQVQTWSPSIKVATLSYCRYTWKNVAGIRECLNSDAMRLLDHSYTNVRNLEIRGLEGETSGLKYIFKNMQRLQRLTIWWDEKNFDRNEIESAICGTPKKYVAILRQDDPKHWVLAPRENGIYALTELIELRLSTTRILGCPPSLSGLTFHMAFMHMPKLKNLTLWSCYDNSSEHQEYQKVTEQWEEEISGRKLSIIN